MNKQPDNEYNKQQGNPYQKQLDKKHTLDESESGENYMQPRVKMSILTLSTLIYVAMAGTALVVMWFWHGNVVSSFALPKTPQDLYRLGAISALGIGVLLIASHLFEGWFASYRRLRNMIMRLLGGISVFGALYLAAISAVGEELLFRGAIQPFAGIFLTSIMFGLLHIGPDGKISTWSIWTMLAGVLLGLMYEHSGNIVAPIVTHFGVNAYSLLRLRRYYARYLDGVAVQIAGESDDPTIPKR